MRAPPPASPPYGLLEAPRTPQGGREEVRECAELGDGRVNLEATAAETLGSTLGTAVPTSTAPARKPPATRDAGHHRPSTLSLAPTTA